MEAKEIDKKQYEIIMKNSKNAFHNVAFCELNRDKVDQLLYIAVYKDSSPRFAFPIGVRGREAFCPFSAPFGYPEPTKGRLNIPNYEQATDAIEEYFEKSEIEKVTFFFPPEFYDESAINMWKNVLCRHDWQVEYIDISYFFRLADVSGEKYETVMDTNARRNLRIAQKMDLELVVCKTQEEKAAAYQVILENRNSKGYVLRMTEQQVMDTMKVIPSTMYLVRYEQKDIAAALIYEVNDDAAQLIYWGDIPGYTDKKAINYLANELIKIYNDKGFKYLDIGPATDDGIPNYGLCDFKESIGCVRSTKVRVYKKF